jgi:HlyD family secretion protein
MMAPSETNMPRPRRRTLAAALFVGLLAVAVVLLVWGVSTLVRAWDSSATPAAPPPGTSAAGGDWYTVKKNTFDLTVVAAGELEAKHQVEIKSKVEGQTTIVRLVDEGVAVKAGDELAKLADDRITDKLDQANLDLERARADQVAATQDLAIQQSQAQSDVDAAEVKLALAELDLSKWLKGDDLTQLRDKQLALEKAKRTIVRAKRDLELSKQLYEEKFISLNELEDSEVAAIEAEAGLKTAEQDLEVYKSYTHPKDERKATSDVEQARAELDRTKRKGESDLARVHADLDSKTHTLKIRQEAVDKLNSQLEATLIKAPADGLVVYASSVGPSFRRNNPIIPGRQVNLNESIFILPDTSQMVAALKVHEALLPQVKIGQSVTVNIDARPGAPISGKVCSIAVMAEDSGWMNPDLREFMVRVDLDLAPEAASALKPAMRASGTIAIGRVEDAIAVPVQAVASEGRESFCYVSGSGGKVHKQAVKIGRASETFVEVTEGLTEGMQVLTKKPKPADVEGE